MILCCLTYFLHVVLHYDLVQEGITSPCLETLSNAEDALSVPSQTVDMDKDSLPTNVPATEVRVQHSSLYDILTFLFTRTKFFITSGYIDSLMYMIFI